VLGPATRRALESTWVQKIVTGQESASESHERSDSKVSGEDRLGSIWIAIQRTPDSAPPDSWILAPGSYY
jgi:hypothetical protein